jgi:hypothetical protein
MPPLMQRSRRSASTTQPPSNAVRVRHSCLGWLRVTYLVLFCLFAFGFYFNRITNLFSHQILAAAQPATALLGAANGPTALLGAAAGPAPPQTTNADLAAILARMDALQEEVIQLRATAAATAAAAAAAAAAATAAAPTPVAAAPPMVPGPAHGNQPDFSDDEHEEDLNGDAPPGGMAAHDQVAVPAIIAGLVNAPPTGVAAARPRKKTVVAAAREDGFVIEESVWGMFKAEVARRLNSPMPDVLTSSFSRLPDNVRAVFLDVAKANVCIQMFFCARRYVL